MLNNAINFTPEPARSLHILLVEDHDNTRAILHRRMTLGGHRVTTAVSVAQASEALANGTFELMLSAVGLPDGTGYDVIAALREKSEGTNHRRTLNAGGLLVRLMALFDGGFRTALNSAPTPRQNVTDANSKAHVHGFKEAFLSG